VKYQYLETISGKIVQNVFKAIREAIREGKVAVIEDGRCSQGGIRIFFGSNGIFIPFELLVISYPTYSEGIQRAF
jgi:hypothetical protein